jgi:hypothetical protein
LLGGSLGNVLGRTYRYPALQELPPRLVADDGSSPALHSRVLCALR